MTTPLVPVSWGELYDKISILEIKVERIAGAAKVENVRRELAALRICVTGHGSSAELGRLRRRLQKVNEELWDLEDRIREKERDQDFDSHFVELARSVYLRNDERAGLKREINQLLQSEFVEEKSYRVDE